VTLLLYFCIKVTKNGTRVDKNENIKIHRTDMWKQIIKTSNQNVTTSRQNIQVSFFLSQLILFQSRRKWGIIFALATVTGFFCTTYNDITLQESLRNIQHQALLVLKLGLLPTASFMIIIGMYVLNDLSDADIDRANGKKRPIPLGQVSKKQAVAFVIICNVIGILITTLTYSSVSILIALMIAVIGLMYSLPKTALKNRFIIKTLSIAIALMLCSLLGSTGLYGQTISNNSVDKLIVPLYAASMLGIMIFVTSPLNDLGDIDGDKEAGRRTIPIAIGKRKTVKLSLLLSYSMLAISWITYTLLPSYSNMSIATPVLVSLIMLLTIANLRLMLRRLDDVGFIRSFVQAKSMPLHVLLQLVLIAGALFY
jgi:geranylgeranylglycerol-phosphate geranylgeranyltransferase